MWEYLKCKHPIDAILLHFVFHLIRRLTLFLEACDHTKHKFVSSWRPKDDPIHFFNYKDPICHMLSPTQ